ncbi:cyclophilin-like domain-containing protein [Dichotomocladium elegans]|nr:cyclophilin-like domain-containing protein [Dichotomocladium elegans]
MSNIYALEPHTNAKVILHTTAGDIEIELWGKETPRTTRNFIQLCMEGYYDNTIFHRIVRDFIVQGGDPTGTGHGGESIYEGEEFPNEYHSRLRFTRRGLVGMANTEEGSAGSQFFITLDRADELTKTHTLFGRVAGDTVYNVVKMAEMETDVNERPLYPPRIKSTEIVLNPFDDIVPRITEREKRLARQLEQQKKAAELEESKKKSKKKEKKQLNLLSFGEEATEMEPAETTKKTTMKSSYDFLPEDQKMPAPPLPVLAKASKPEEKPLTEPPKEAQKEHEIASPKTEIHRKSSPVKARQASPEISEIERLKQDIRKMERDRRDELEGVDRSGKGSTKKKISLIEEQRLKYARRGAAIVGAGKERKKREIDDTYSKLLSFQKKLTAAEPEVEHSRKEERPPCKLHLIPDCESCYDTSQDQRADENDDGWMSHKLIFEKDKKGKDLMQRTESVDDYVVIDPRARQNQVEQEERDKRRGGDKRHHRHNDSEQRKRERDYDNDRRRDDRKRTRDDYYDRRRR